jgi:glycosyltransferase involved in cell wall biosynthesis
MRLAVVTNHLPHPGGTAAGRQLWAWVEAALHAGHAVDAWCWGTAPAGLDPPDWCRWEPFTPLSGWRVKLDTVRRPRHAIAGAGWQPAFDPDVVWVDDWGSQPVVPPEMRTVLTVHYSVSIDANATRRWSPALVQDLRGERRGVRSASRSVALSERVRRSVGADGVVPATTSLPTMPVMPVEEPVALMLANWAWRPNQVALDRLLRAWPDVLERVRGATLLLAGRNLGTVGTMPGVRVLGEVADPVEVMAQAAVFVFPCPASSGVKVKVMDAMFAGLPVLTTPAGVEGLSVDDAGVFVEKVSGFGDAMVRVLSNPVGRASVAQAARGQVAAGHHPDVAAAQRLAAAAAVTARGRLGQAG